MNFFQSFFCEYDGTNQPSNVSIAFTDFEKALHNVEHWEVKYIRIPTDGGMILYTCGILATHVCRSRLLGGVTATLCCGKYTSSLSKACKIIIIFVRNKQITKV